MTDHTDKGIVYELGNRLRKAQSDFLQLNPKPVHEFESLPLTSLTPKLNVNPGFNGLLLQFRSLSDQLRNKLHEANTVNPIFGTTKPSQTF